ncbi:hypothetical protein [Psychromonas sp. Urea-02u-13]|uniref:hypothetical protein n=1 Tax=Psychromonas sp. Urea-02u-13 TaxID=2058326 RepID=UPI000C32184A|nr:hypothetical protein [Psychromonas sp. Urea-02u-13]PKG37195.1 hypothetical protein CXF74_20140 [Psychromonas sp. Urea-02u-13]
MFVTKKETTILEQQVKELMAVEFGKVPKMENFHTSDWFNENYYKRHILECLLRIHMNNEMDSRAVAIATQSNTALAKMLSYYVYDELGHDEMFARDLDQYGYTATDIQLSSVFSSTMKLMGYLNFVVEKEGPMVAVVWDWFLEFYGDEYNPFITEKAAANMGQAKVDGAAAHVAFDEEEDHSGMMTDMLGTCIKNDADFIKAQKYLSVLIPLVGEYFNELQREVL